jgi:hypothetical protein
MKDASPRLCCREYTLKSKTYVLLTFVKLMTLLCNIFLQIATKLINQ